MSALAIALVNINPVAHAGLALGNVTRIELGEPWPQYRYLTPAIARLIGGLDAERRAVAGAFGLSVRTIADNDILPALDLGRLDARALGRLAEAGYAVAERRKPA